jgi:dCMP deaminase
MTCKNCECENTTKWFAMDKMEKKDLNENILKWDQYFYNICDEVSKNSSCLSRRIGAILVKDKTIIGSGYNGPPRGIPHCNKRHFIDPELKAALATTGFDLESELEHCPRKLLGYKSGEGLQWCVAGHGERNALINSARMGISTKDTTLFMNCGIPCTPCLIEIINSGVKEIVCIDYSFYDSSAKYLLDNSKLKVRIFSHLCKHLNWKNQYDKYIIKQECPDCGLYISQK